MFSAIRRGPAMNEGALRRLLDGCLADEPPIGPILGNAIQQGARIRRWRRIRRAAGTAAVAAAIPLAVAGLRLIPVAPHATGPRVPAAYVLTDQGLEPIGSTTK